MCGIVGFVGRGKKSDIVSMTERLRHRGPDGAGYHVPRRLNGMFAFAVLDKRRRKLFLARDRFGEKPLYYTKQHGLFAFSSEIKGFQEHPELEFNLEPRLIAKYFAYGFLPAPHTPYREILKLPAGGQLWV